LQQFFEKPQIFKRLPWQLKACRGQYVPFSVRHLTEVGDRHTLGLAVHLHFSRAVLNASAPRA
jgi:hypothetical protein